MPQRAVLIIRYRIRRAGQGTRDRKYSKEACDISLWKHKADVRGHTSGYCKGDKGHRRRDQRNPPPLFQPYRRPSIRRGVPNNLVPFITQTAIGKRECLSIFGNDYPTPDGTCLRDYIDIVDLAKAHVFAVGRMLENKMKADCEIFNIGTGKPVSVLELVNSFERVNGLKLNYKFAPRRAGDVTAIWADPTLANKEMGWKAERSVDETLAAAWAWEKHLAGK